MNRAEHLPVIEGWAEFWLRALYRAGRDVGVAFLLMVLKLSGLL